MSFTSLFASEHVLALLTATLIFVTTIFLVVKQWIGFSITLLLLIFSLLSGLVINHQSFFQTYFDRQHKQTSLKENNESGHDFQEQVMQAIENLKEEVKTERENLNHVVGQIQEIFDQMELQTQKLQSFIEETREHFNQDSASHEL